MPTQPNNNTPNSNVTATAVPQSTVPQASDTVPMFAPDGSIGDIPRDKVGDAAQAGFSMGVDMISPKGVKGTVPLEKAHDALKAGFTLAPAPMPKAPQPEMKERGVGQTLGLVSDAEQEAAEKYNAPYTDEEIDKRAEDFRKNMPESTRKLLEFDDEVQNKAATAFQIEALAGMSVLAGPYAGKVGQWILKNPVKAIAMYHMVRNPSGFIKAVLKLPEIIEKAGK